MYKHELFKARKDKRIEDSIIKDVRNLIRLAREIDDTVIKLKIKTSF